MQNEQKKLDLLEFRNNRWTILSNGSRLLQSSLVNEDLPKEDGSRLVVKTQNKTEVIQAAFFAKNWHLQLQMVTSKL